MLTLPRSGSNALAGILDKHKNVSFYYEELRHDRINSFSYKCHDPREYILDNMYEGNLFYQSDFGKNYNTNTIKHIKDLWRDKSITSVNNSKAIGFKLFPKQCENFKDIIENKNLKVIHLHRKNILKQAMSLYIAITREAWVSNAQLRFTKENGNKTFKINKYKFRRIAKNLLIENKKIKEFKNNFKGHLIKIEYNEINNLNSLNKLFEFMKVDHITEIPKTSFEKQSYPGLYQEIIENYDEIADLGNDTIGYL